jgi:hypothetical protein
MYDPFVVEVFDGAGNGPDDLCCVATSPVESKQTFRENESHSIDSVSLRSFVLRRVVPRTYRS